MLSWAVNTAYTQDSKETRAVPTFISNAASFWLKRLALTLVALVALWLLSSYAVAYKLTRRIAPRRDEPVPDLSWGQIKRLSLQTVDGEAIGCWHIPGTTDRPRVVLLHGNSGQKSACLDEAELLHDAGCSVLLVSLRAHGESSGDCNDFGYSARHDLAAAVQWLEGQEKGGPIVVWGQSLGAAAACFACGDLEDRVHGYILECPYRDLHAATWNRLHARLPAGADWLAYAGMRVVSPLVLADVDSISPCEAIRQMPASMPVLLLAGSQDLRAPPDDSAALCENATCQAELVTIAGAGHLQLQQADATVYREAILALLDRSMRQRLVDSPH